MNINVLIIGEAVMCSDSDHSLLPGAGHRCVLCEALWRTRLVQDITLLTSVCRL